jgi:nucleoside-diphosphate-sugar epimerase
MRVVLAGSAAELGPVDAAHLPVGEGHPADPIDAYGRSKWLATRSGLAEGPPLEVMCARIFNPVGPGTPPTQAFGAFAARLAEPGPDPLDLPVGPLGARRDFVDVRDVARAMIAIAMRGCAGRVYHVGTGESHAVAEGLDWLVALSGRSVVRREDPALLRRPGPPDSRAAIGRVVAETGWEPRVSFGESLRDLWEDVRHRGPANPWSGAAVRLPLTA